MKFSSIKKVLILATILSVPGFLYYLLQAHGKNHYVTLPHYGPKKVATTFHTVRGKQIPDTIYYDVKLKLINQDGDSVNFEKVNDQVHVVSLFYTNGGYAERVSRAAMSGLFNTYKKNRRISFLSITVDPANDTPGVLRTYRTQLQVGNGKWDLVTGQPDSVFSAIRSGLLLDVLHEGGKISFSNTLVLLDHRHNIRGYYDATNKEAIAKLDDEIKVLMAEELRNINDGR